MSFDKQSWFQQGAIVLGPHLLLGLKAPGPIGKHGWMAGVFSSNYNQIQSFSLSLNGKGEQVEIAASS